MKVYRANKNIFRNILLAAEDRTAQRSIDDRGLNWCGERDFRPLLLVNNGADQYLRSVIFHCKRSWAAMRAIKARAVLEMVVGG